MLNAVFFVLGLWWSIRGFGEAVKKEFFQVYLFGGQSTKLIPVDKTAAYHHLPIDKIAKCMFLGICVGIAKIAILYWIAKAISYIVDIY